MSLFLCGDEGWDLLVCYLADVTLSILFRNETLGNIKLYFGCTKLELHYKTQESLSHFFFEIPAEEVNIMSNITWKQSALLVGPEFSTPQSSIWESRFGAYVFRLKV